MSTTSPSPYAGFRDKVWTRCFAPTKRDHQTVCEINERCDDLNSTTDAKLAQLVRELRGQAEQASEVNDRVLMKSLAVTKQSLLRTAGMLAYDVQILGGIAMCRGAIAEMQTGEGKTLTCAFPTVFYAIQGRGVHVATVNSYLAERDFEFLRPTLKMLGLSVGISQDGKSHEEKSQAYACDVTFATGYELGFDFLRDQIATMARGPKRLGEKLRQDLFSSSERKKRDSQRGHAVAIIDEIDSVLIDEAITPLVLSSGSLGRQIDRTVYQVANQIADLLVASQDFVIEEKNKFLYLTARGSAKAHQLRDQMVGLMSNGSAVANPDGSESNPTDIRTQFDMLSGIDYAEKLVRSEIPANYSPFALLRPWQQYVESALRAKHIMIRDINYVVREEKVEIVDEFTGRIFSDRNWRDGLHQAVEAREGVPISEEKRTLARISRQRYFQRYDALCGMTGTASGHERELYSCYELPIVVIPSRKSSRRTEIPTRYFASEENKIAAIVNDVIHRGGRGQPILIGTRTIEQTRMVADELQKSAIGHQVLNGIQDADEATLISVAGCSGSVTVATNMAGRGTDIKPNEAALAAGGLHVIGYERNLSLRIDRQLLGRAGRQGDPGTGQFFVSAEDEIVRRYDPGFAKSLRNLNGPNDGRPNSAFDQRIRQIQMNAEKESLQSRQQVMNEELWMDEIKKAVG